MGMTYSYLRLSHMVFALKPPVTRLYPKNLKPSGSASLMRSRTPGGSSTMRRAMHWPTALTPLSVLAARVHWTLVKSPALSCEMPPAFTMARSSSSSMVFAPGLRWKPWYPLPTYARKAAILRFLPLPLSASASSPPAGGLGSPATAGVVVGASAAAAAVAGASVRVAAASAGAVGVSSRAFLAAGSSCADIMYRPRPGSRVCGGCVGRSDGALAQIHRIVQALEHSRNKCSTSPSDNVAR